jgi:hypothetical protein
MAFSVCDRKVDTLSRKIAQMWFCRDDASYAARSSWFDRGKHAFDTDFQPCFARR